MQKSVVKDLWQEDLKDASILGSGRARRGLVPGVVGYFSPGLLTGSLCFSTTLVSLQSSHAICVLLK